MFNSIQHKLAKLCINVLKLLKIFYSKYNTKDSFSFVQDIVKIKINEENIGVCSFNIKSFITSLHVIESPKLSVNELFNLVLAPKHVTKT